MGIVAGLAAISATILQPGILFAGVFAALAVIVWCLGAGVSLYRVKTS